MVRVASYYNTIQTIMTASQQGTGLPLPASALGCLFLWIHNNPPCFCHSFSLFRRQQEPSTGPINHLQSKERINHSKPQDALIIHCHSSINLDASMHWSLTAMHDQSIWTHRSFIHSLLHSIHYFKYCQGDDGCCWWWVLLLWKRTNTMVSLCDLAGHHQIFSRTCTGPSVVSGQHKGVVNWTGERTLICWT